MHFFVVNRYFCYPLLHLLLIEVSAVAEVGGPQAHRYLSNLVSDDDIIQEGRSMLKIGVSRQLLFTYMSAHSYKF